MRRDPLLLRPCQRFRYRCVGERAVLRVSRQVVTDIEYVVLRVYREVTAIQEHREVSSQHKLAPSDRFAGLPVEEQFGEGQGIRRTGPRDDTHAIR